MAKAKKDKTFSFNNIGPIDNAELELGDLTVIAGANNSGKTYLTYTLYGFLEYVNSLIDIDKAGIRQIIQLENVLLRDERIVFGSREVLRKRRMYHRSTPNLKITINSPKKGTLKASMKIDAVKKYINDIINYACDNFSSRIGDVFASPQEFKEATLQYEMKNIYSLKNKMFALEVNNSTGNVEITLDKDLISFHKIYLEEFLRGIILGVVISKQLPAPFILSAERLGISLFYKELDFTKSKIIEVLQKMNDESFNKDAGIYIDRNTARYAKPIKDNIDYTRDLNLIQKRTGDFADHKIFDDIKNMMKGYYRYKNNDVFFISQKRGDSGFKIHLHSASSSVRVLSDFYFHLKYTALEGQLLIIDEPESHLDTANQILMARMLVRCVNAGMKVLITTHSDYIIKEFNNLIMLSHEFPEKKSFLHRHKKEYTADNFLNIESVKAYVCGKGILTPCKVDSRGMIMPIFDKTIDDINNISDMLDSYLPREK